MSRNVQVHASMESRDVRKDVNRLGAPLLSLSVGMFMIAWSLRMEWVKRKTRRPWNEDQQQKNEQDQELVCLYHLKKTAGRKRWKR